MSHLPGRIRRRQVPVRRAIAALCMAISDEEAKSWIALGASCVYTWRKTDDGGQLAKRDWKKAIQDALDALVDGMRDVVGALDGVLSPPPELVPVPVPVRPVIPTRLRGAAEPSRCGEAR